MHEQLDLGMIENRFGWLLGKQCCQERTDVIFCCSQHVVFLDITDTKSNTENFLKANEHLFEIWRARVRFEGHVGLLAEVCFLEIANIPLLKEVKIMESALDAKNKSP
jgi:hypothetical protein